MNRNAVSATLVVALMVLGLAACQPSRDTNLNAAATASPAKETIDVAAIQAEVLKLERDWFKAGQTHDAELMRRIVADDATLVYPDGALGNKAEELRLVEAKAITVDSWEVLEPKVTVMSADSAFITGRSVIKNGKYKEAGPGGKLIDISGEYRFLDVYARRNGIWQVIASQATKVAAPSEPPPPVKASPTATSTASPSP